ncbi:hypothetical protein BKI52_11965 [marine bacterium AO1-C]|nr:hypothetical protein BKI52_11965 [marine bacterium AO1-C]
MSKDQKQAVWIETGYLMFASSGEAGLNIKFIAEKVGKSKSSFYHHFGDTEVFTEALLKYHIERARQLASQAQTCEKMDPDVLKLLIEFKHDLFFNKQLRLNRQNPAFKKCFEQAFKTVEVAFIEKWAKLLRLEHRVELASILLSLISENFFLRITEETFDYDWFHEYLQEVASIVRQISLLPND